MFKTAGRILLAVTLLAPVAAHAQRVIWNYPLVSAPGQYDRLLLQQNGPSNPYSSVTVGGLLGAGLNATFGTLNATSATIGNMTLGALNNTPIGNVTPGSGVFSTLTSTGLATLTGGQNFGGTAQGTLAAGGASINFGTGAISANSVTITGTGVSFTIPSTASGNLAGPIATQIGTSILYSGAKCDGVTDDAAVLNTWLAGLVAGTSVLIPAGKFCKINSTNLTIPAGIAIVGQGRAIEPQAVSSGTQSPGALTGSGFVLNPSYTVLMNGSGSSLSNLGIWRSGLTVNPSAAQVSAAVSQWGSEYSVAVMIPNVSPAAGGILLDHLFIEGFNTAIVAKAGQFSIFDVWGDDYNGLRVWNAGDTSYVRNVHFEPFYSFGVAPPNAAWTRPGVAFYFYNSTGIYFSDSFAFMWENCGVTDNMGIGNSSDIACEWNSGEAPGTPHIGWRFLNNTTGNVFKGGYVTGYKTDISIEGGVDAVESTYLSSNSVAAVNVAGPFAANPPTTTITASVAGGTITETFTSAGITGSPVSVTYTAQSGDAMADVAAGLTRLVNSNEALADANISAYVPANGTTVTFNYPASITVTVGISTAGGVTATTSTGTAMNAPTGSLDGLNLTAATAPFFQMGTSSGHPNAFIISRPHLKNGTSALPSGWLTVPNWGQGSVQEITLDGIQWSQVFAANLSACGTSPSVSFDATDAQGTITEGTTAAGCTVTFTTPFYRAPSCIVTSPNGAVLTGYTTSTTALTITNASASGNKYTYQCLP